MIKEQRSEAFDPWLDEAEKCQIKDFENFATGIRSDYNAIKAALEHPWSNGQVEAQVDQW